MKGRSIPYSAEELAWIEARKETPRRELCAMFCAKFNRTVSLQNFKALCSRKGWKTGRTGFFKNGQTPHNKGKPFNPAGSEKGRFKKGNLPHNTKYLGHERLSKEGYVEVSVDEPNPHTGFERRYVLKHRHLWEQVNGPVPDGYVLKSIDGDKTNTDPANWEAIPRALLPRLSGGRWCKPYDAYEPELRPLVLTTAKLDHAARAARKAQA
ncbi:HNH endonuclease signature motif containing protein [Sulfitobacter sp. PS-8MA]|uniref:HNH endonuclease signature motif containing protein n=1 Tax=Sulfitobacter sp. PS-8MA TaxID=3237707 RepID=UPI0034C6A420